MTASVAALAVVLAIVVALLVGLLRSHAEILRRLHELDESVRRIADAPAATTTFRPMPGLPDPGPADDLPDGADIVGTELGGDAIALGVVGVEHDTVLAFLSSGCTTCQRFWRAFADVPSLGLPHGTRLVVVVKDPSEESPSTLAQLAPPGLTVVHSSAAWDDYRVPGSPYFVLVDGARRQVRGEGTGLDWEQVSGLLAQATGDLRFTMGEEGSRIPKPRGDADRELELDLALLAVGITPGDPSLYATQTDTTNGGTTNGGTTNGGTTNGGTTNGGTTNGGATADDAGPPAVIDRSEGPGVNHAPDGDR